VADPQVVLPDNEDFVAQDKVIVAMDAASQGILNRDYAVSAGSLNDGVKNSIEGMMRHGRDLILEVFQRGQFAVGAGFTLKSNA
jgi:hypothetical protein